MKRVWDIGGVFHQMVLLVAPTNKNMAIHCRYTQCVEKRSKKKTRNGEQKISISLNTQRCLSISTFTFN